MFSATAVKATPSSTNVCYHLPSNWSRSAHHVRRAQKVFHINGHLNRRSSQVWIMARARAIRTALAAFRCQPKWFIRTCLNANQTTWCSLFFIIGLLAAYLPPKRVWSQTVDDPKTLTSIELAYLFFSLVVSHLCRRGPPHFSAGCEFNNFESIAWTWAKGWTHSYTCTMHECTPIKWFLVERYSKLYLTLTSQRAR